MEHFILELKEKIIQTGMAKEEDIKGISDEVLDKMEAELLLGSSFPKMYRDFMKTFGLGAGWFFQGTDIFYPSVLKNREILVAVFGGELPDPGYLENEDKFFVFAAHQGYEFFYFDVCDEGPDPSVSWVLENQMMSMVAADRFSVFLQESFEQQLAALTMGGQHAVPPYEVEDDMGGQQAVPPCEVEDDSFIAKCAAWFRKIRG